MKLQIVEYKVYNILKGIPMYRYMLELNGIAFVWTGAQSEKMKHKEVYSKLTNYLLESYLSFKRSVFKQEYTRNRI